MAESASVSGRARPSGARARGELIASAPLAAFGVLSERYAGPGESANLSAIEDAVHLEAEFIRTQWSASALAYFGNRAIEDSA